MSEHRCLAVCYVTEQDFKRCQLPVDHYDPTWSWHTFVSATNVHGKAIIVRWKGNDKNPTEILNARRIDAQAQPQGQESS